jgi:hypothetical protein
MAQPNDARETNEMVKHPLTSIMFYGGLALYALIVIIAIVAIMTRGLYA